MIRILHKKPNGEIATDLADKDLPVILEKKSGTLWLDFEGEPTQRVEELLTGNFSFHPLAIDDAINENHIPKLDDWEEYLLIIIPAFTYSGRSDQKLLVHELDVFLGPNFLVTYSPLKLDDLQNLWNSATLSRSWPSDYSDYLLYLLLDECVNGAVNVADQLHAELDDLEIQIFRGEDSETLEKLFTLKRNILQVRRYVVPFRDVTNKLSRFEHAVVGANDLIFFRDVYDHLLQLDILLNDMLILVGGALDSYLSVVNNRLNEIVKTLTIITALFMPLAFVTGFFGMNFFQASHFLEFWTGKTIFYVTLFLFILSPLAMLWWMRRRLWI